jgi:hypothetical protein
MLGVEPEWEDGQLPKGQFYELQLPNLDLNEKGINLW